MKKRFLNTIIVAAISLTSVNTYAQDAVKTASQTNFMIGVTGGASIPIGNYVKTDYDNPASGFATAGFNLGVTGTLFIKKHFGISALISYHSYGVGGLQQLADGFHRDFDIDSSTVSGKGSNSTLNFLIGPYYSLPLGRKLSLDGRILVGVASSHLAGYKVEVEDQSAATFSQDQASAVSFSTQAGLGLRYSISPHFGLILGVDYFYTQPDFTVDNTNRNNNAGRLIKQYNEPITGINTNLTLVYALTHK